MYKGEDFLLSCRVSIRAKARWRFLIIDLLFRSDLILLQSIQYLATFLFVGSKEELGTCQVWVLHTHVSPSFCFSSYGIPHVQSWHYLISILPGTNALWFSTMIEGSRCFSLLVVVLDPNLPLFVVCFSLVSGSVWFCRGAPEWFLIPVYSNTPWKSSHLLFPNVFDRVIEYTSMNHEIIWYQSTWYKCTSVFRNDWGQ